MIGIMEKIDEFDLRILTCLQTDGAISQRDLADRVGLSQNACWRRLQRLNASGIVRGTRATIDLAAFGLDLTVFVMIRTRHHS
jgi:Lrp/AsnC family transcriptional regulator